MRGRGTLVVVAVALLTAAMTVTKYARLKWAWLVEEVRKAREAPARPHGPDKDGNSDHVAILVRPEDGPVVDAPNLKTPLPLSRVPVRSIKKDLERAMIAIAEKHSGKKNMRAIEARKYLKQLARDNPDAEIAIPTSNLMVGEVARLHKADE